MNKMIEQNKYLFEEYDDDYDDDTDDDDYDDEDE